ncbi:cellulase family glycosylhydrolase [Microbispora sp. NEAU-D428]|uniref:glycoside hydrolase 5 family protein n=1 Tax=Microbispora sitophila TaxID=2771537 RepID=UPI0018676DEA|nr:cellulase family glycosylhydrolase [Microbispora sitophila]MBE3011613.1 cellulase family glycosylhydrolase [Microbispora sitophila]
MLAARTDISGRFQSASRQCDSLPGPRARRVAACRTPRWGQRQRFHGPRGRERRLRPGAVERPEGDSRHRSKEIGENDGTSHDYFQYWDGTKPAYNDGEDGLRQLDYVLARAAASGIRLIIPLVTNWRGNGGMDQYVRWAGGQYHDDFYTNPVIKGWYKDWITHLLNRVNTLTGVAYKDDPTIMAWELANAPRCKGGDDSYPTSSGCTAATITAWADEMSQYVKSVDGNHLLSVGDEGFYCTDPGGPDWTNNCSQGVDTLALARLPEIDLMSPQLFADKWGKDAAWGTSWITQHLADGREIGKPVVLSAFGLPNKAVRNPVYRDWTDAFRTGGGAGFAFWQINEEISGQTLPDLDGYTVDCPGPVCRTITNAGMLMNRRAPELIDPVADDDTAVTAARTMNPGTFYIDNIRAE